jgi:hypothetical protein
MNHSPPALALRSWSRNVRAVSEANRRNRFGLLRAQSSLSIQPCEGSRSVRGGRYRISIDFVLEVVEKFHPEKEYSWLNPR